MSSTSWHPARYSARHAPVRWAVFLALSVAAAWPAVRQAGVMNMFHDAQFLSAYERHARLAVVRFGQLPLWDPYSYGGIYGLAAPQTRYASPFGLLSVWLGVDLAASILAALLPALAMEGMFRYARSWGAGQRAAFLAAPLFPLCGWFGFAWHFGWVHFFSFCLVPWILLGLRRALRGEPYQPLACALWVAAAVGFGGTYTLPMLVLPGLVEALSALGARSAAEPLSRRARDVGQGIVATTALVLGVAAYRLWPLLESAPATLRTIGGLPQHDLAWLARSLFVPVEGSNDPDGYFFVAPWAALVALPALLPGRVRARGWLWALLALSLVLSLGHAFPYAPFELLRKLPIYEALRAPGRYLLLTVLMLGLLVALGLHELSVRVRRRAGERATRGLWLGLSLWMVAGWGAQVVVAQDQFAAVQTEPIPEPREAPFRQSRGNRWLMSHFAAEGMGSLGCGEAYPVPMSQRLRGDLPAEEYLVDVEDEPLAQGAVERLRWTPNALTLRVRTPSPARLAINQNYHPGWRSNVGEVQSFEGLLSVWLPAGEHEVQLRFLPRSGPGGFLVSVCSILGGLGYGVFRRRRPALRAGALALGPVVFLGVLLAWEEPAYRRPLPRDARHQPVFVDTPPPDARRLGVRFDVPLWLEAARLPDAPLSAGSREVELSLFLRRTGTLGPAHALFVHLRGPQGQHVGADHAALSGVVYLPRMPEDQLVRDRFVVPLPHPARGTWQVYVGLWDAFGDQQRRALTRVAPDVGVEDSAVHVGSFRVR